MQTGEKHRSSVDSLSRLIVHRDRLRFAAVEPSHFCQAELEGRVEVLGFGAVMESYF
jgi:hypothetical protein